MFKLISKLGFIVFAITLLKLNSREIKRIFISILLIILASFFYSDLTDIFKETYPENLFLLLISKWVIILLIGFWGIRNILRLKLSEKGLKEKLFSSSKQSPDLDEIKELLLKEEAQIKGLKKREDFFKELEDLKKYPKLKTGSEKIYEE
tara:strand:- start:42 stop:491 length:450 start_codon:yes stop_codon:yes gene_type:complete